MVAVHMKGTCRRQTMIRAWNFHGTVIEREKASEELNYQQGKRSTLFFLMVHKDG